MSDFRQIVRKMPFMKPVRRYRQIYLTNSVLLSGNLIKKGESGPDEKKAVVIAHAQKHPELAARLKEQIERVLSDGVYEKNPETDMGLDMYFYYIAYGFTPFEYICYGFPGKSREERLAFGSDRFSINYAYHMNDVDSVILLSHKEKTCEFFKPYLKREYICVRSEEDRKKFEDFVSRHSEFIKKLTDESCGRGIELLSTENRDSRELFTYILSQSPCLLEEKIIETHDMSRFNADSVNTVRCFTVNTGKEILTPWCFMRAGRKGAVVDNGGEGGLIIGIDTQKGILNSEGVDELNHRYSVHPDSGVPFKGYELPEWSKMLELCREMAGKLPGAKWIGWDMAYTEKGWLMVEGNGLSEVIGPQCTTGKGIRGELMELLSLCR